MRASDPFVVERGRCHKWRAVQASKTYVTGLWARLNGRELLLRVSDHVPLLCAAAI